MRFILALIILAIFLALTTRPTIEEKAEEQLHKSESIHDSAMKMLVEIHEANDSLLIEKYFYKK